MRKTILGIVLAAGVAVPTIADAGGLALQDRDAPRQQGDHPHGDGHGQGQGGGRHDGGRPAQAPQAAAPAAAAQPAAQAQVQARGAADARFNGGRYDGQRGGWNRPDGDRVQGSPPVAPGSGGYRPQGRPAFAPGTGGYRPQGGPPPGAPGYRPQGGPPPGVAGFRGNPGYGGNPGYRPEVNRGGGNWNRTWRDDRHYDWRSYRTENRTVFNLPRYYAPRGWGYGYRRFAPGLTLSAVLYGQDYWINDPFYYRLPPAYGPYRWVRYYNDALLIDLRTGAVVDTVYDIFW